MAAGMRTLFVRTDKAGCGRETEPKEQKTGRKSFVFEQMSSV